MDISGKIWLVRKQSTGTWYVSRKSVAHVSDKDNYNESMELVPLVDWAKLHMQMSRIKQVINFDLIYRSSADYEFALREIESMVDVALGITCTPASRADVTKI